LEDKINLLQVDDLGEDCLISAAKTCMSSKLIGADSGNTHILINRLCFTRSNEFSRFLKPRYFEHHIGMVRGASKIKLGKIKVK
jgi:hypothetical protein